MTGISVGDYRDPERGLELGDLMRGGRRRADGVERVRLSSVEVIHVRDSLLDALAEEPRICPHLHVPLQSGDDARAGRDGPQLRRRGLPARRSRALRERVPHVNLTTDVIVGYPTEDEAAFERTLELVRAAGITKVHTFSFSPRPGHGGRPPRRPRAAAGEEAPQPRAARAVGGARPPPPRGEARRDRGRAGRQGRRRRRSRATAATTRAITCRPARPPRARPSRPARMELYSDGVTGLVRVAVSRGRGAGLGGGGGPAGLRGAGRGTSRRGFGADFGTSAARSVKNTGVEPITQAPRKVTHTELYTPRTISAIPMPTQMVIRRTLRWPARSRAVTLT